MADQNFATIIQVIESQNTEMLGYILENPNVADQAGNSALMVAAVQDDPTCVFHLLMLGADPNLLDIRLNSALMKAAKAGRGRCVQALIDHGANVHLENGVGDSALNFACLNGHLDIAKSLIDAGSPVDRNGIFDLSRVIISYHRDSWAEMKEAIDSGLCLSKTDERRNQYLISSSNNSSFKKEKVIFSRNVTTGLMTAPELDAEAVFKHSMVITPMPENRQGQVGDTPLICASRRGHADICLLLLKLGADPDRENSFAMSPLMIAAAYSETTALRLLLESGAQIAHANECRRTALHVAAANGAIEAAKLLLDAGADLECVTAQLDTPLSLAVKHCHLEMVKFLISKGANVNCRDSHENTLLILASAGDEVSAIVKHLLLFDPQPNSRNIHGCTALIAATRRGHVETIQYLLGANGIDVNMQNKAGKTAVEEAAGENSLRVIEMLHRAGARIGNCMHYAILRRSYTSVRGIMSLGVAPSLFSASVSEIRGINLPVNCRKLSPFALSICIGEVKIAKFLATNLFLHASDYNSLGRDTEFRNCLLINNKDPSVRFLDQVFAHPWTLLTTCLVTVSHLLGCGVDRSERVKRLGLPHNLTDKLLFRDDSARLDLIVWRHITLEKLHGNN